MGSSEQILQLMINRYGDDKEEVLQELVIDLLTVIKDMNSMPDSFILKERIRSEYNVTLEFMREIGNFQAIEMLEKME